MEYFDKYLFESDPHLLRRVAEAMQPLLPPETELLGGLELGGVPLATMISSLTGIPAVFVRKKAKEYGTRRLAEGADVSRRRVTLIEDIITTGGAARDATNALRAAGGTVSTVVCAIDRSDAPGRALADVELDIRTVSPAPSSRRRGADRSPVRSAPPGAVGWSPARRSLRHSAKRPLLPRGVSGRAAASR